MSTGSPSKRRVVAPRFGEALRRLRGRQSRGEVCRVLASKGLALDRSTLLQYERGTVATPNLAIVWTLAKHYGVSDREFARLTAILTHELTGKKGPLPVLARRADPELVRLASTIREFPITLQKSVITVLRRLVDVEIARRVVPSRRSPDDEIA